MTAVLKPRAFIRITAVVALLLVAGSHAQSASSAGGSLTSAPETPVPSAEPKVRTRTASATLEVVQPPPPPTPAPHNATTRTPPATPQPPTLGPTPAPDTRNAFVIWWDDTFYGKDKTRNIIIASCLLAVLVILIVVIIVCCCCCRSGPKGKVIGIVYMNDFGSLTFEAVPEPAGGACCAAGAVDDSPHANATPRQAWGGHPSGTGQQNPSAVPHPSAAPPTQTPRSAAQTQQEDASRDLQASAEARPPLAPLSTNRRTSAAEAVDEEKRRSLSSSTPPSGSLEQPAAIAVANPNDSAVRPAGSVTPQLNPSPAPLAASTPTPSSSDPTSSGSAPSAGGSTPTPSAQPVVEQAGAPQVAPPG